MATTKRPPATPRLLFDPADAPDEPVESLIDRYAPKPEGPGLGEAVVRGAAQGVTLGFADEIAGALKGAFTAATTDKTLGEAYTEARDESRGKYRSAREAHPIGYGLAQILGGTATALVPGGSLAKLGTGAAGAIARGAGTGIAAGAGESEASTVEGVVKDAATGGLVGGALGGVGYGLSRVLGGKAGIIEGAPERRAQQIAQDVTRGSNMTNKKRFAQVQELAGDYFERDKELHKLVKSSPADALDLTNARLGELGAKTKPHYDVIDRELPMSVGQVRSAMNVEIAKAARQPGADTWGRLLKRARDSFVSATTQDVPKGVNLRTVPVPTSTVRTWVTNLLEEADHTIGSLAETERWAIKDRLHAVADKILKSHLEKASGRSPVAKEAVADLRRLNKDIVVLAKTKDALKPRVDKEIVGHEGIRDVLREQGLPGIGAIAGAGGDPLGGIVGALGTRAALATADTVNRASTAALARLVRAARAGDPTAMLAKEALEAGVPRGTVEAVVSTGMAATQQEAAAM